MEDLPKGGTSYLLAQCTSSTSTREGIGSASAISLTSTVKNQKGLVAAASNIA